MFLSGGIFICVQSSVTISTVGPASAMSLRLCRNCPIFYGVYLTVRLQADNHYAPFQWPQGRQRELESREEGGELSLLDSTRATCVCVCVCDFVLLNILAFSRSERGKAHHNTVGQLSCRFQISILSYSQMLTGGAVDLLFSSSFAITYERRWSCQHTHNN